jgi:phosphoribosylamine---glycine ligase
MKVLLVGSGGREHALAWGIARSPRLTELHAAPGNPGIARLGHCHPVRAEDGEGLLALARSLDVELVVIGPEAPLVAGVGDELRHAGVAVFGPSAAAARIEGSKSFAKEVMAAAGVASADTLAVARAPCVLKADGLAAGKGVFVCHTREELDGAMQAVAAFEGPIVIEELLEGEEVSVFALVDGSTVVPLAPAQDFKRLEDGDRGPNTGGMGAYSPVPTLSDDFATEVAETVHQPVVDELARRGTPFVGLLYAGLMLTADGLRVLEFNCRFGDPETQVVVPRLATDLLEAIAAAAGGELAGVAPAARDEAAVTVVAAAAAYPERGDAGSPIQGVDAAEAGGALVFHAGTASRGGDLVTNGGRVLTVTGLGPTVGDARDRAYDALGRISFAGMRFRTDIAAEAARVRA